MLICVYIYIHIVKFIIYDLYIDNLMRLSLNDYTSILKYYNIATEKLDSSVIKQKAEDILAKKLCRCIKKVDKNNEAKAIAVCTKSVITRKHLKIAKFKCKTTAKLLPSKNQRSLRKTEKTLKLGSKLKKLSKLKLGSKMKKLPLTV
jgi:hypothetical protein